MAKVKALRLGKALAKARAQAGLSLRDAAQLVDWKHHRLHNLEQGKGPYRENEVATLLGAYGVTGAHREQLLLMTQTLTEPVWWELSMPGLPGDVGVLTEYEAEASRITEWAPLMIPGLLQTMGYARAWMVVDGNDASDIEVLLTMRSRRQQRLHEEVEYRAYVTEHALRMPPESRAMHVAQLDKLLEAARRPNVSIGLIPVDVGLHRGQLGGFVALEFSEFEPLVQVEHLRSVVWMTEDKATEPYLDACAQLESVAVDATELIEQLKRDAEGTP